MKKILLTLVGLLALTGSAYAAEQTLEIPIDKTTLGQTSGSYVATQFEFTVGGFTFIMNNINPTSGQIRGNQNDDSNANFYFANKTAMKITKIEFTLKSAATTFKPATANLFTSDTQITKVPTKPGTLNGDNPITVEDPKDYFWYQLYKGGTSGTCTISKITITYDDGVGGDLLPNGLSFGETTEFNANLGETFTPPALINPNNLEVTYDSSEKTVATVSADGKTVTLLKAGKTTITATFAGNETYRKGDASYTLNVVDPNAKPYTLIKDINLLDGAEGYIVCNTQDVIMTGLSGSYFSSGSVTVSSDKNEINDIPEGALLIKFTKTGEGSYSMMTGGQYINSTSAKTVSLQNNAASAGITITETDGTATIKFGNNYLKYNSGSPRFTTYASGQTPVQIYAIAGDPSKENAGLSFGETTTFNVLTTKVASFNAPELKNPNGLTVSYKGNNDEVGTVDAGTGVLTLTGKPGTLTVTATSEATDKYNEGNASYTVNVELAVSSIAEILKLSKGTDVKIDFPMTVGYNSGRNVYATDGTDWIQLYKNTWKITYAPKDIIPAGYNATFTLYNDIIPELSDVNGNELGEEKGEFTVKTVTIPEINSAMFNHIVTINAVNFKNGTPAGNATIAGYAGTESINFYQKFDKTATAGEAGYYNVTGIVDFYNDALQIDIIEISEKLTQPELPVVKINGEVISGTQYAPDFHHLKSMKVEFTLVDGVDYYYNVSPFATEAPALAGEQMQFTKYTEPFEITGTGVLTFYAESNGVKSPEKQIDFDLETGVDQIGIDPTAADVKIYDLMGRRVSADRLAKGVYIMRQGEKTAKIYVK